MPLIDFFLLLLFVWNGASCPVSQDNDTGSPCKEMAYENRNQIDYGPLHVRTVKGLAKDPDGVVIPKLCVGIFTDPGHKLVATTETNAAGSYEIKNLPRGNYRLVAKYAGFCPANVRLQVQPTFTSNKTITLRMRPAGLDTCSFGELGRSNTK
jgi:hypothetical protein